MILKLLNGKTKTIAGAAFIVGFFTLASRFVGLVRDRILAGEFGAGDVLDVYFAAFRVPDLVFNLLVLGALSASFIPLFVKHYTKEKDTDEAWRLASNSLNILGVALILISVVLIIFARPLAGLITPGFDPAKLDLVAQFMRVMFISNFIIGLSTVFGGILQGAKRFFIYSLAPIAYNFGIIIGILVLTQYLGLIGLAWGVVLGAVLHLITQASAAFALGYRWRLKFETRHKDVKEIFRLMGPRVLGLAVSQANFLVITVIASTLAAGSLTIFQFAYNINSFPVGIFGIAYAIAAFPALCEFAERKQIKDFISSFSQTTRQILFFIIPSTILFLILRAQIVRVVVGAGLFGWEETIITANTLAFFTLSFFAQALVFLLVRAYFSLHDTVTPFIVGLVSVLVNVLAALYFSGLYGVLGLAIGFSIASIVQLILLWIILRGRLGSLGEYKILRSLYIFSVAGIAEAVVIQVLKPIVTRFIVLDTFFSVLAQGLIAGGIGLLVYCIVAWYLRSPEMRTFLEIIRKRLFRKYRYAEGAEEATGV